MGADAAFDCAWPSPLCWWLFGCHFCCVGASGCHFVYRRAFEGSALFRSQIFAIFGFCLEERNDVIVHIFKLAANVFW